MIKFYTAVKNCARCSQDHTQIEFKRFKFNPIDEFEFWGSCPTTGEPILLKIEIRPNIKKGNDNE